MSNIRKEIEDVTKQERTLDKIKETLKCQCTHTKKGDFTLVRKSGEERKWICKQCQKIIAIERIDENELQKAIDIIDNAIDVIKLSTDTGRDDDAKVVEKVGKMQYRLRNEILPFYKAAVQKNKGGQRRDKEQSSNSGWNKPNII